MLINLPQSGTKDHQGLGTFLQIPFKQKGKHSFLEAYPQMIDFPQDYTVYLAQFYVPEPIKKETFPENTFPQKQTDQKSIKCIINSNPSSIKEKHPIKNWGLKNDYKRQENQFKTKIKIKNISKPSPREQQTRNQT